jgi:hypothetical protein
MMTDLGAARRPSSLLHHSRAARLPAGNARGARRMRRYPSHVQPARPEELAAKAALEKFADVLLEEYEKFIEKRTVNRMN